MTIKNFTAGYGRIEKLQFSDGLTVDLSSISIEAGFTQEVFDGVRLDGVDDYVRVTNSEHPRIWQTPLRLRLNSFGMVQHLQLKILLSIKKIAMKLLYTSTGAIKYALKEGTWVWITTDLTVVAGQNSKVALTYDKATRVVRLYLNGTETTTALPLGPVTLDQTSDDLLIGIEGTI